MKKNILFTLIVAKNENYCTTIRQMVISASRNLIRKYDLCFFKVCFLQKSCCVSQPPKNNKLGRRIIGI